MMIKGIIQVDAEGEIDRYPIRDDVFAAYYRSVTGEDVPPYMTALEKRAFAIARAIMEEN